MKYCEEYAALISAAVDNVLTADERRKLMDHLAACPACREAYTQMLAMHSAFAGWEEEVPGDLAGDVMAKIRKEKAVSKSRRRSWLPLVAAAACCALVFIGYQGMSRESNTVKDAAPAMDTKAAVSESIAAADTAADTATAADHAAAADTFAYTTSAEDFRSGEEGEQLLDGVLTYFSGAPESDAALDVEKTAQEPEEVAADAQTLLILTSYEEALVSWMAENTAAQGHTSEENATTAWLITQEEYALLSAWLTSENIIWEQYLVELPYPEEDVVCVVYLPS